MSSASGAAAFSYHPDVAEVAISALTMLAMFSLAIGILWIRDCVFDRPPTPEELERQVAEQRRQLRNPDWPLLAPEFGGVVPESFRALYSDERVLLGSDLVSGEYEIHTFIPADEDAFDSELWFNVPDDAFVFATTVFGDPYYVRTSESERGFPVYLLYHDGGDTEVVRPTLEEFARGLSSSSFS